MTNSLSNKCTTKYYYYYLFNDASYSHAYVGQTFSPWCHTSTSLRPLPSLALALYPSYPYPTALSKSSLACPTSAACHFQVTTSAHHILLPDLPELPQSTPSHNLHHTLNSESSP